MRIRIFVITSIFAILALGIGCQGNKTETAANQGKPADMSIRYAKCFSIEQHEGYTVVAVTAPWPGSTENFRYLLYPRGSAKPAGVSANLFVETPIKNAITFSTSYVAAIAELGRVDTIIGIDNASYVINSSVRANVVSRLTQEVMKNMVPDIEAIVGLEPDAIFTYGMGNEFDTHPKMIEAGLPIVLVGDWNEADPLGRAEWIKFFAAFYGLEREANAIFDAIEIDYRNLKKTAEGVSARPVVAVNGPYQSTWWVAGGASYQSALIADAGGEYLWKEGDSTGSVPLTLETAYVDALKADVWLNPGMNIGKIADVVGVDPRFKDLPCMKSGNVWNNTLKVNDAGFTDYAESGAMRPNLVLADMIKILHPELLADREFTYFKKLEK